MIKKIIEFIFFGNYFVGLLVVALSVESAVQLHTPLNSPVFYLLMFSGTMMYYTYAYSGILYSPHRANPRTVWYARHHQFIAASQRFLLCLCILLCVTFAIDYYPGILHLPLSGWLVIATVPLAALLYYGLLPKSFVGLNLRDTGWLKAFVIGFVWACSVTLLPLVALQLEQGNSTVDPVLVTWFFIKNWMFCTVNAIMFDLKDYEDDSNRQLKTFVVKFGVRYTIFYVLIPLLLAGIISVVIFFHFRHFKTVTLVFNLIPFFLLLAVAWSMLRSKKILYYLIVIDGLLLVKALCGIAGTQF